MPAAPHPHRSRRWIPFFVVLAGLAAAAIVVPIVFNLSVQLRPEQLAEARQRWQQNSPANYDLEYLVKTTHSDAEEENAYLVHVRNGRIVLVLCDNEVVYLDAAIALVSGLAVPALSSENPNQFGVRALLDDMESRLSQDEQSTRRRYSTAQFDPKDGHPLHYVHRIRGTRERVEWNVKITPR